MAQVINTNMGSMNAQRNLSKSQVSQQSAIQRLSSGLRINSAKDDAAGMSISERMTSQIKGLDQATRNANDGISLAQTAEGALGEMTNNLQRLRELAVQSANATNTTQDRASIQQEATQLIEELSKISSTTSFNGSKLLDGSFEKQNFQVGANAGQNISVSIGKMTVDKIGAATSAGASSIGDDNAITKGDLVINGITIRSSVAADDTASTDNASASAISKVAAINSHSAETNVVAKVSNNVAAGSVQSVPATAGNGTMTINGVETANVGVGAGDVAVNRKSVIDAINAISGQTGVTAVDTGKNETGVDLVAADGRNIQVSFSGTLDSANTGVIKAGTYEGGFTLQSTNGKPITVSEGTGSITHAGMAQGTIAIGDGSVSSVTRASDAALEGTVNVAAGADFAGVKSESFSVSVSGGKAVNVVMSGTYATGAEYAAGLQTAINDALGGDFATVNSVKSDTTTGEEHLQIMSSERLTFGTPTLSGGGASAAAGLSDLIATKVVGGPDQLRDGDLVLNGIAISAAKASDDTVSDTTSASASKASSGIAIAAAINAQSKQSGVTATTNATEVSSSGTSTAGTAGAAGAVYINGHTFSMTLTGDAAKDRDLAVQNFNAIAAQTGVTAQDTGDSLKLTAADGRNISLVIDTNAAANTATTVNGGYGLAAGFRASDIGLDASVAGDGVVETDVTAKLNGIASGAPTVTPLSLSDTHKALSADYAQTTTSKVTLHAAGSFTVSAGINGSEELAKSGFKAGNYGGSASGQHISDIDLTTVEGANKALTAIDNALSSVSTERSNLGAVQNRFTSTISNLQTSSDNLTSARSRIQDADFAAESAALSRAQVLQQAGTAMLAQANQTGQGVLSLLR